MPDVLSDISSDEEKSQQNKLKERQIVLRVMGQMSQLGITAVFCIVIGLVIGRVADNFLGTAPIFFVIFAVLGCFAAIKTMMDMAKKFLD